MSTNNLKLDKVGVKNTLRGFNYVGKHQFVIPPSLPDHTLIKSSNPISGGVGTTHEMNLLLTEDKNLDEVFIEFDQNNLDGTLSQVVVNPFLLFSECKLAINNGEVWHLDDTEKIFNSVANYLMQFDNDNFKSHLTSIIPTYTAPLSGQTTTAGTTTKWSLPLWYLFPGLKSVSLINGVRQLNFWFRFQPNTATPDSIGRFMKNATNTNNPYTSATISFTNIQLRAHTVKVLANALKVAPSPVIITKEYDNKSYLLPITTNGEIKRIQFSTDFSRHPMVNDIVFYIYDPARITAYNDADCFNIDSSVDTLGFELKFRSRTILKYEGVADKHRRFRYYYDVYKKRFKDVNLALLDGSDNTNKYWIPATRIDLQCIDVADPDQEEVYSGLPSTEELELILYNNAGSYSTGAYLHVALGFLTETVIGTNGAINKRQLEPSK